MPIPVQKAYGTSERWAITARHSNPRNHSSDNGDAVGESQSIKPIMPIRSSNHIHHAHPSSNQRRPCVHRGVSLTISACVALRYGAIVVVIREEYPDALTDLHVAAAA